MLELELELQANTVRLQMWVLQTKLGSSRKVVRALDNESCLQPMALYFNKRKPFKPQYKIQRSQNEAGKFVRRFWPGTVLHIASVEADHLGTGV